MEISKQDLQRIHEKFISDPDWKIVERLIEQFIEPLKSIDSISTEGKTSDEVFAELKGNQTTYRVLNDFLNELRLVKTGVTKSAENQNYR